MFSRVHFSSKLLFLSLFAHKVHKMHLNNVIAQLPRGTAVCCTCQVEKTGKIGKKNSESVL